MGVLGGSTTNAGAASISRRPTVRAHVQPGASDARRHPSRRSSGGPASYVGTVSGTYEGIASESMGKGSVVHQSWSATGLRFNRVLGGNKRSLYQLVEGIVSFSGSLSETFAQDPCPPSTYNAAASMSVLNDAFEDPAKVTPGEKTDGGALTVIRFGGSTTYSAGGKYFKAVTANGTFVGVCAKEQLCNGNAPLKCVSEPEQKKIEVLETWFDTEGANNVAARDGSLSGSASHSEGEGGPFVQHTHWTWSLTPQVPPLRAVPGGPYTVGRGGVVHLDGSSSTPANEITSYEWTFTPNGCPAGVALDPHAAKRGARPEVVALCPLKVTLTVSDGSRTASATTTIRVNPRKWSTPVAQRPYSSTDPGFNPPPPRIYSRLVGGVFRPELDRSLGLNVSACTGASRAGRGGPDELVCPLRHSGSWAAHGFSLTERPVHDPGGPFDGFYYVNSSSFQIVRQGLLNHWIEPGSPPDEGAATNFYDFNQQHGTEIAGYLAAVEQHEGFGKPGVPRSGHTLAIKEALATTGSSQEPVDPRALAERQFGRNRAGLIRAVDALVNADQQVLYKAAEDPLPVIWEGEAWVWSPKHGGDDEWKQFVDKIGLGD
jgi:hypothetical protein